MTACIMCYLPSLLPLAGGIACAKLLLRRKRAAKPTTLPKNPPKK